MKRMKTLILGIAATAGVLLPLADANAWIAAGRGGFAVGGYHGGAYYHPGGCYGCGAAAGAVAGVMVGAAVASAARPTVIVDQPTYVAQQPIYVNQSNAPLGTQFATLPAGSRNMVVNGVSYYQNGATWYKPYFGSSGVYYEVVPAP
jgi:hypothetical protein